jgi:hypothetical protein
MGDKSASLNGKREFLGGPFIPASKDLFFGQAIKGDIQFNAVKILSVEFEPLPLGKIGGIEETIPPMGVVVAACADQDHISNFRLQIEKYGKRITCI